MPKLIVNFPEGSHTEFELLEAEITIGRTADNAIQIEHASVSSSHAVLVQSGDGYTLRDVGSTNGTKVNGQPIEAEQDVQLNEGDTVRIGHIDGTFGEHAVAGAESQSPKAAGAAAQLSSSSARPSNFRSESPFGATKGGKPKKHPVELAVLALAGVALLASLGAIVAILGMKSPV